MVVGPYLSSPFFTHTVASQCNTNFGYFSSRLSLLTRINWVPVDNTGSLKDLVLAHWFPGLRQERVCTSIRTRTSTSTSTSTSRHPSSTTPASTCQHNAFACYRGLLLDSILLMLLQSWFTTLPTWRYRNIRKLLQHRAFTIRRTTNRKTQPTFGYCLPIWLSWAPPSHGFGPRSTLWSRALRQEIPISTSLLYIVSRM